MIPATYLTLLLEVLLLLLLLLLLLKIFKEGGPSAAAVFQEALHLNTWHSRKGKVKSLITI